MKNELKEHYRLSRRRVNVDPLDFMESVNLDEIYTNLSLTDRTGKRKSAITYEDIMTRDDDKRLSKRILIHGEAGVGKTTLCSKIAWDWCSGRILQDLDMVLVIPLRDVSESTTIDDVVKSYISDSSEVTANQIDYYISRNPSKILLVLDGFDEFSRKIEKKSSCEVIRILGLEKYKLCKMIVTTRPWKIHEFTMEKSLANAYTFISIEGFSKDNLQYYIRRYFQIRENDTLAEDLITFMEDNDVIRSNMAPFPIYCAMLCLMWKDISEERRRELLKLQTFSQIFENMISFLKEHYASKPREHLKTQNPGEHFREADRAIQDIAEIALEGLLKKTLSFPKERFNNCRRSMDICCQVGVLTIETGIISRERRRKVSNPSFVESTVTFPHKLFQEYIAGVYLSTLFADDHSEYERIKYTLLDNHEEFRYVLYFSSSFREELGLDIIEGLVERSDHDFCVDVAFECHAVEAARRVERPWPENILHEDMSDHTISGMVFMIQSDQVPLAARRLFRFLAWKENLESSEQIRRSLRA
ncbi:NACHT, LRR and PYD domains-containing protein 9B-like [Diadema antillarum]|uniref:NACHT, LRR and PYD domains-containing protein 9B-like n=1 Tax=Diadema antillarum TaxID=105358 RepID=UPI003A83CCFB